MTSLRLQNLLIAIKYFPATLGCFVAYPVLQTVVVLDQYRVLQFFNRLSGKIPKLCGVNESEALTYAHVRRVALFVERRCPFQVRCLVRAITLQSVLRLYGLSTRLCLGAKYDGAVSAHAWLEADFILHPDSQDCVVFR